MVVAGCGFVDVGLWVWDCGGGKCGVVEVGSWFASDEKEENSPKRREEETEK